MKAVLPEVLPQGIHVVHNDEIQQRPPGGKTSNGLGFLTSLSGDEFPTPLSLVESYFEVRVAVLAGEQALYVEEVREDGLLVRAATPQTDKLPAHTVPPTAFDRIGLVRFDELEELQPGTVPFLDVTPGDFQKPPHTSVDEIADKITALLSEHAPEGWTEVRVECDALAGWQFLTTSAVTETEDETYWLPPLEVSQWFHRLRSAGFVAPGGAWYRANFVLVRGESPTLRVDWAVEPRWKSFFPAPRYGPRYRHLRNELAYFPTPLRNAPDWLVLAAAQDHDFRGPFYPTGPASEPVSLVRTFDGIGPTGEPKFFRPVMGTTERGYVLDYLDMAPVVLASRELVPDLLDPTRPQQVPMAYQTDGRWVWSSSVAYYLRTHGVCPDLAFLAHVRLRKYQLPDRVPSAQRARALSTATNQLAHALAGTIDPFEAHEPGLAGEFEQASKAVLAVAAHLDLEPASYSLGESVDGALCLVREGDRYVVFWLHDEDRRFYAEFDSPGDAATYLIGFFYSYAGSLQRT
ncbi:hypothetical protein AB0M48_20280 [Lentzea sp. NPDC051208]|uniref:hypothetical protein n=1 Tax=Lentzea sp. NPDC051208 TaxID=3154642 RepID=UPI0034376579